MRFVSSVLFASLAAVTACAAAQYPSKPIRLVVPFAAGGGTDLLARLIAQPLADALGQQVVVDNRGGAGSVIGSQLVATAPSDGYTLGFFDTAFTINAAVTPSLPYDSGKDFAFVSIVATSPTLLVVRGGLPFKTLSDLVAHAKANPGKLTFGSAGTHSSTHLTGEMFNAAAGVKITHVPFRGQGGAITDILGGHIDITYSIPGSIAQHLQAGTLRALAITGASRSPLLPAVPTFESLGLAVNPGNFRFMTGPAGLPAAVETRLTHALAQVRKAPGLTARMTDFGYDAVFSDPAASRAYVHAEIRKWRTVMPASAVKLN
jgi:tripartite-type tricarboxylate transporter receptor subunit TctC